MKDHDRLETYRQKRNFRRTSEPSGEGNLSGEHPVFVIQKHAARRLHYDFRLEVNGVLKSWAVPKGPPEDSRTRRLAVPTEDHPLEYARFEGVIPAGEYGGGTVMVWDIGTYRNLRAEKAKDGADMERSLQEGTVEIYLEGEKLKGAFALVKTKMGGKENWLLLKKREKESPTDEESRQDG